jgi:hypothetical protein
VIIDSDIIARLSNRHDADAVAVSVSLGSQDRDSTAIIPILGRRVRITRFGVNGDMQCMAILLKALDGRVDALGIGGADFGCLVDTKWYPFLSITALAKSVRRTPVVDGSGLKIVLERKVSVELDRNEVRQMTGANRNAFLTTGCNRWGLLQALRASGFHTVNGDLMFGLGLPFPIRGEGRVKLLAAFIMPVVGHFPFEWLYPVGEEQHKNKPRWQSFYKRSSVIAGDTHYITHTMPESLAGKIIIVNTVTNADLALFKARKVAAVITTTPLYEGRGYGTNVLEAALLAASGRTTLVDYRKNDEYLPRLSQLVNSAALSPSTILF